MKSNLHLRTAHLGHALTAGLLILLSALQGCGGGGTSSDGSSPPENAALPAAAATVGGTAQTASVDIAGPDGTRVRVAPNTLDEATTVRIARNSSLAPALPASAAGAVYELTPHGASFNRPVTVEIPFDLAALANGDTPVLLKADPGGSWAVVPSVRDGNVLRAQVASFSYFAALGCSGPGLCTAPSAVRVELLAPAVGATASGALGPATTPGALATVQSHTMLHWAVRMTLPASCLAGPPQVALIGPGMTYDGQNPDFVLEGSRTEGGEAVVDASAYFRASSETVFLRAPATGATSRSLSARVTCGGNSRINAGFASAPVTLDRAATAAAANGPLAIVEQPADATAARGAMARFNLVTNTTAPVVQWERSRNGGASWTAIPQATREQLLLQDLATADDGLLVRAVLSSTSVQGLGLTSRAARLNVVQQGVAPSFTSLPRSQLVLAGQSASFTAVTGGLPQAALQWQTRPANSTGAWADVPGAQAATYTTAVLGLADNGTQFRVLASNSAGTEASPPVTASVSDAPVAPQITLDLSSIRTAQGGDATFAVAVRGTEPLNYEWHVGGQLVPGQYAPVLNLSAVAGDTTVQLTVSNAAGTVTSRQVALTVVTGTVADTPVAIVGQPTAPQISAGQTVLMAVQATGTNLHYRWQYNGQDVNGFPDSPLLQLVNATPLLNGSYRVVVSNSTGSVTSNTVQLQVPPPVLPQPLRIDGPPRALTAQAGQQAAFVAVASGTGTLRYQWFHDNQLLSGANQPYLVLEGVSAADQGIYRVQVTDDSSSTANAAAFLTVVTPQPDSPVVITGQPPTPNVSFGQTAILAVQATGGGTLHYRWQYNGADVVGFPDAPVLLLRGATPSVNGSYRVVVSNGTNAVTSDSVQLVVGGSPPQPLSITVQPVGVATNLGQAAVFAVQAQGTGRLRYQWLLEGVPIPGAESAVLLLPAVSAADVGNYSVQVNDDGGVPRTSNAAGLALVSVPGAPQISATTTQVNATVGDTPRIAMTMTGPTETRCLWLRNGALVTGATDCSGLTLPAAQLQDTGSVFTAVAYNAGGSAVSAPVVLGVAPAGVAVHALTATQVVAGYEWSLVLRPDRTVWGWGWLHSVDGRVVVANLAPADQARVPVRMYPSALTDIRQIAGWYDGFWALKGEPGTAAARVLHWGNARSANDGRGSDGAGTPGALPQSRINASPVEMLERRSVNGVLQSAPVDRVCSLAATADRVLLIRALDAFGLPTDCNPGSAKTVWVAGTLTQYGADAAGIVTPVQGMPAGIPARVVGAQVSSASSSAPALVVMEDGRMLGWATNTDNLFGLPVPANLGTVGNTSAPQALPAAWGAVRDVAFSYVGLLAARADGSAAVSGRNARGELGVGPQASDTVNNGPLPLLAAAGTALDGVQSLASTNTQVSLALRQGFILAWGAANHPLQGGSTAALPYPRLLPSSGDSWRALSASHGHALAIAANGAVYAWGNGLRGALGNGLDSGNALAPALVTTP